SEGERTRDLTTIQREQAAYRGQSGPAPQREASAFYDVQRPRELAAARENLMGDFNRETGELVARTPGEAGGGVQQGVEEGGRGAKAGVTAAYEEAKGRGGVIHSNVFEDIGTSLRRDLAGGSEPVLIDEKLTPYADAMLKDADAFFKRFAPGESGG